MNKTNKKRVYIVAMFSVLKWIIRFTLINYSLTYGQKFKGLVQSIGLRWTLGLFFYYKRKFAVNVIDNVCWSFLYSINLIEILVQ